MSCHFLLSCSVGNFLNKGCHFLSVSAVVALCCVVVLIIATWNCSLKDCYWLASSAPNSFCIVLPNKQFKIIHLLSLISTLGDVNKGITDCYRPLRTKAKNNWLLMLLPLIA